MTNPLSNQVTGFDPLTCDWHTVWRYQRVAADRRGYGAWDEDCDCGAPPEAHHIERCSITPIYAALTIQLGSVWEITREIYIQYVRTYVDPTCDCYQPDGLHRHNCTVYRAIATENKRQP